MIMGFCEISRASFQMTQCQSTSQSALMSLLKRILRGLTFGVLAAVLLFEEWGWEPLAHLFARLARLPLWGLLERKITSLPRWGALLVFGAPMVALLPVKLLALFLFGRGHAVMGLTLLLSAKLLGTAILARLFQLTQPALMKFEWFSHWYPRWKAWKDDLMGQIRKSEPWQWGHRVKASTKAAVKAWWRGLTKG